MYKMTKTDEIVVSLRACAGECFECIWCDYYDTGDEHLYRLHLDAAAELERLDRKLSELRQLIVDNIDECQEARDKHCGQLRDQLDGCVTALGFVLRWIEEEGTDESREPAKND